VIGLGLYNAMECKQFLAREGIEPKRYAEAGPEIMRVAKMLEDKAAAQQLEQAGARRTA
jgi:hypothetical protein